MRGLANRLRRQEKMLELNLQAISVQRAIDGALEKLLFVQTKKISKFLALQPDPKFFKNAIFYL